MNENPYKKWTWPRYIFTNIIMVPLSASAGAFVGDLLWQLLAFLFLISGQLLGADVNYQHVLQGSTEGWFIYIGAALGVVVQFWWLWEDEMTKK